jgi:hypothetical protein
LTNVPESTDAT